MDETIYVILKVLFDFALEVWFSIVQLIILAVSDGFANKMSHGQCWRRSKIVRNRAFDSRATNGNRKHCF